MTEREAIEQLAALLDGEPVAEVPASLGALATLATSVRDHADVVAPTAEFRSALRQDILAAAAAPPGLLERTRLAWGARTARLRTSTRMAVAAMTASSMLGTAGVAVAAQDALPGELLYGLKNLTEDVRLALAEDGLAQARLHLAFAEERLDELEALTGQLDSDEVVALLAAMDFHSEAGAEALMAGVTAGQIDATELRDFTASQRSRLTRVLDRLPLLARPVAEDSLELLRRIEISASGVVPVVSTECDCDDPATGAVATDGGSTSTRTDGTGLLTDIVPPGEGPAVPASDCDCIELPGGSSAREQPPSDTSGDEGADEPDDDPFTPKGGFSDAGPTDDGERDDDLSTATTMEELPLAPATEPVEDATGADVSTGPADRTLDGVGELLD